MDWTDETIFSTTKLMPTVFLRFKRRVEKKERIFIAMAKINVVKFELFFHPVYWLDVVLNNYHLFTNLKTRLGCIECKGNVGVINAVNAYFKKFNDSHYEHGIAVYEHIMKNACLHGYHVEKENGKNRQKKYFFLSRRKLFTPNPYYTEIVVISGSFFFFHQSKRGAVLLIHFYCNGTPARCAHLQSQQSTELSAPCVHK